ARSGFGALLLGVYEGKDLRYCGKVGTGFGDKVLQSLIKELRKRAVDRSPFVDPPTGAEGRRAHWVKPELVGEVSFTEWTRDGTLRHPSFEGLREDKRAREIVREQPVHAASTPAQSESDSDTGDVVAGVPISNGDKVLYPEDGITKRTLARYYEAIGELMVPHVKGRPLTLVRCPNGWDKHCFYQKH